MKLVVRIMTGSRKNVEIVLTDDVNSKKMPWFREDEVIELSFRVPSIYKTANLIVNQHFIDATYINKIEDADYVEIVWSPKRNGLYLESMFFNYFGISKFNVLLKSEHEVDKLIAFQPVQILARLDTANKVDNMFYYLSSISSKHLYSFFSATSNLAGFEYGKLSPDLVIEQIEFTLHNLNSNLSFIINNKISRLVPEYKISPSSGSDELDDASLGWLLENLSVLEPDDIPEQAHIYHDGQYYRASSMLRPNLIESTDVYENQIIHGFLKSILHEVQQISTYYDADLGEFHQPMDDSGGYVSFFTKLSKFKKILLRDQSEKIDNLLSTIRLIQSYLERYLPVSKIDSSRPIITHKVHNNHIYRTLFIEIIKWHEARTIDWSVYDKLFSIQSAPELFEVYCYFRLLDSINTYFDPNFSLSSSTDNIHKEFIDANGNEVKIEKEPKYWVYEHTSMHDEKIINSEGFTRKNGSYSLRSQSGPYSNRSPDYVLQIKSPEGDVKLLILDAKYTSREKAFLNYLPDLTMKYIHGIHKLNQINSIVNSLSILYPGDGTGELNWTSYHHYEMSILGKNPVEPSLQSIGVELGEDRKKDNLNKLVIKLLEANGVVITPQNHSE